MNTVQYKCPNCGGELVFNPEKQMFSCPYCASDFTEAEMEERYHTQNETAQKEADADAKIEKLLENPAMFKTPIVRNGRQATVGYCPDVWKTWE